LGGEVSGEAIGMPLSPRSQGVAYGSIPARYSALNRDAPAYIRQVVYSGPVHTLTRSEERELDRMYMRPSERELTDFYEEREKWESELDRLFIHAALHDAVADKQAANRADVMIRSAMKGEVGTGMQKSMMRDGISPGNSRRNPMRASNRALRARRTLGQPRKW